MRVSIINPYGSLPDEGWSPYRSTSIASALTRRGHQVTWWISDFEHRSKRKRRTGRVEIGPGYSAEIVPSGEYRSHASLKRIRYERAYAANLLGAMAACGERPDIIVHAEPAVCFCDISMRAVKAYGVPMVVDIIDLWPELFEMIAPLPLRWLARGALQTLYRKRMRFLKQANGFIAVSRDYLEVARRASASVPGVVVYLGTDVSKFANVGFPDDPRLPLKRRGDIWCIYVGTLGRNYDVETVLRCAEQLTGSTIRIVIAGDGDFRPEVQAAAAKGTVLYLGRMAFEALLRIYPKCDVALACYAPGSTVSMPFKAFDYLAAGLPIITSLSRDLGDFVARKGVGKVYKAGDPDSLVQAVLEIVRDEAFRVRAAVAARLLGATMDYGVQYAKAADLIERVARGETGEQSP